MSHLGHGRQHAAMYTYPRKQRTIMRLPFYIRKILPIALLSLGILLGAPQQSETSATPVPSPKSKDPLNRDSPQSSVFAFMEAYRAHDYARAAKYLNLRKLPPQTIKAGPEAAAKLGQILT